MLIYFVRDRKLNMVIHSLSFFTITKTEKTEKWENYVELDIILYIANKVRIEKPFKTNPTQTNPSIQVCYR